MCRYAFYKYKPHLACFQCHKTFRRRHLSDVSENKSGVSRSAKCPECGGTLADMGLDFKSPPKDDEKAWKHISELFVSGITFHSCGCSGPGYIPKDREHLLNHLEKTRDQYVNTLRQWINFYAPATKKERELMKLRGDFLYPPFELSRVNKSVTKEEVVAYWTERIDKIEQRINHIKELMK